LKRGRKRTDTAFLVLCTVPSLFVFTAIVVLPTAAAFVLSLFKWDGFTGAQWVGIRHFAQILKQLFFGGPFQLAFLHTLFIAVVPAVLILCLSLFFASVLHRGLAGGNFFRVVFFFPNVISAVAVALLWRLIYEPTDSGIANQIVAFLGFDRVTWLAPDILLTSIVPMVVWSSVGFFTVLFLAAMQSIPETLYEAARIDGASNWKAFWHLTLPLIRDTLVVGVVFLVIGGLKFFDYVWVLTAESPTPATHTMATLFYQEAFKVFRIGYGTAISVVLFVIVLVLSAVSLAIGRRSRGVEY